MNGIGAPARFTASLLAVAWALLIGDGFAIGIQGDVENLKQRLFSKVRKTAKMSESNQTPEIASNIN